jgi:iron complex outermembrane receptor protein
LAFFNPKFGARYQHNQHEWYGSFAVANREPNRRDYTESTPQSRPLHETLYNWETGYNLQTRKAALGVNFYYMNYRNQLVLTGQVNDVGGYIRANIDQSYRAGIELQGAATLHRQIKWEGNLSLSRNKIQAYIQYLDNYDQGGQEAQTYRNTDIAFSPSVVGASQWHFTPFSNASISVLSKYVGRQYLDNTQSASRQLDPYFTNDIRLGYIFPAKWVKEVNVGLLLNNIFNVAYESNGYTFGYISGGVPVYENFYYPQAGFNFLMQLQLSF